MTTLLKWVVKYLFSYQQPPDVVGLVGAADQLHHVAASFVEIRTKFMLKMTRENRVKENY